MPLDIKDSTKFIENRITPLLGNNIAPERILEKVIACLRENDKGQSAKKNARYTFISIRDVRDLRHQTCATLASSQVNNNSSIGVYDTFCQVLLLKFHTKESIVFKKHLHMSQKNFKSRASQFQVKE